MPFYLYRKPSKKAGSYEQMHTVSLAGYNAIHNGWKEQGKPINQGWHLDQNDLVRLSGGDPEKHVLLIDLKPSSTASIDLYELLDIYVFTDGDAKEGRVDWNPLMLRLREFWCEQCDFEGSERSTRIKSVSAPPGHRGDIFEFLYLQGEKWTWGRSGQVNGVLLYENARKYFLPILARHDGLLS